MRAGGLEGPFGRLSWRLKSRKGGQDGGKEENGNYTVGILELYAWVYYVYSITHF